MSSIAKRGATIGAAILWLVLLGCVVLAPAGAHVGSDVGYYLPLAEGLAHGHAPLLEVPVHYTPLAIAMLSLPALLMERPPFEAYVVTQLAVIVLGALAVVLFSRRTGASWVAAALGAGYFVLCSLYFESSTMLEPFVVVFIAWAMVLAWTPWSRVEGLRWFLVGVLCALAVLCKQQGLFLVAGVGVLVGLNAPPGERLRRLGLVVSGGAAGAGLLVSLVLASKLGALASRWWQACWCSRPRPSCSERQPFEARGTSRRACSPRPRWRAFPRCSSRTPITWSWRFRSRPRWRR
jgi:hypothetical protein